VFFSSSLLRNVDSSSLIGGFVTKGNGEDVTIEKHYAECSCLNAIEPVLVPVSLVLLEGIGPGYILLTKCILIVAAIFCEDFVCPVQFRHDFVVLRRVTGCVPIRVITRGHSPIGASYLLQCCCLPKCKQPPRLIYLIEISHTIAPILAPLHWLSSEPSLSQTSAAGKPIRVLKESVVFPMLHRYVPL